MSLLGFNAVGRLALGQLPTSTYIYLPALAGSYAVAGSAAAFRINEGAVSGSYTVTANAAALKLTLAGIAGSYSVTGNPAAFSANLGAISGGFVVVGYDAHFTRDFANWLPIGAPSGSWSASSAPSGTKTVPDTGVFYTTDMGMLGVGARRGPQQIAIWSSASVPGSVWTPDKAQYIPPEVVN